MAGKNILITGASSGFGFGAAKALAEQGHTVYASMRGVDGKNAAIAESLRTWTKESRRSLEVVEIDVTDDASVERGVSSVLTKAGHLDILINNAGVGTWGPQESFTSEQVKKLFDTNVVGMLRMNRAVLPSMRKLGAGYIIYVSSGLGRIILPFLGPYTATKHAVEAIAECGSIELGRLGIDTTILQPGAYGTSFFAHSMHPDDAGRLNEQPVLKAVYEAFSTGFETRAKAGHLGKPEEIVQALVELVGLPKEKRPLRKTVGADVGGPVGRINDAAAQVQDQLLTAYGLKV